MYTITHEIKKLYEMNPRTRIRLYDRGIELDHHSTVIELISLGRSVKFCIKATTDQSRNFVLRITETRWNLKDEDLLQLKSRSVYLIRISIPGHRRSCN